MSVCYVYVIVVVVVLMCLCVVLLWLCLVCVVALHVGEVFGLCCVLLYFVVCSVFVSLCGCVI